MSPQVLLTIAHTWDGVPIPPGEQAAVTIRGGDALHLHIDAPWHGDPAPSTPPGPTDRLWEHEVVEFFLLGAGERYLELEFGPHGHHLALRLEGRRTPVEVGMALEYRVERAGDRWRGEARVPLSWLPPAPHRANAYAIHGVGEGRRYLAWAPTGGGAPDFHRLEAFRDFTLPG